MSDELTFVFLLLARLRGEVPARHGGTDHVMPDAEAFEKAGIYDPDAGDAAERLELLRYLAEHGLAMDEIAAADRLDALQPTAVDRLNKGGRERITLDPL